MGDRLSEVLYVTLCGIIGTPTQVKIRRDMMDTKNMIQTAVDKSLNMTIMESGSMREGFRLRSSDFDIMYWSPKDIVLCDLVQIPLYHPHQVLILMECHDTPSGFAKLRLLNPTKDSNIRKSLVSVNNQIYISSSAYREVMQKICQSFPLYKSSTLQGPCTSGVVGNLEYDLAFCFSCPDLPPVTYQWIHRCKQQGWPSSKVLQDIISYGCHLVPISSEKPTSLQSHQIEWRLSFSRAEYSLVHCMNHTQFLCYGLLKIFLKEVLNVGINYPLLCSYFMKTLVFWKIQSNIIPVWCSQNILSCFWNCFKHLIQCVYMGEFPNFFIPENNMFLSKLHGAAQKQLFLQLLNVYNMGISCLLLSPSLRQVLTHAISNPHFEISSVESNIIFEFQIDAEIFVEVYHELSLCDSIPFTSMNILLKYWSRTTELYHQTQTVSPFQTLTLQVFMCRIIQGIAFHMNRLAHSFQLTANKKVYCFDTVALQMLQQAAIQGSVSDSLYIALYYYNSHRYMLALKVINKTMQYLTKPFIWNLETGDVDIDKYANFAFGQSFSKKIGAVAWSIKLNSVCSLEELKLEVDVRNQNEMGVLSVPPFVMIYMLSFLCHHHLGHSCRSKQALINLFILVNTTQLSLRDVPWQVLGICQQIIGDYEGALCCYLESLKHPLQNIQKASVVRIKNVVKKMNAQNSYM